MKLASDIVTYGRPKPFFDTKYDFNTLDIETLDNELFLLGVTINDIYTTTLDNFYTFINDFFISCLQNNKDILSWSKYDNTFIIKTLLGSFSDEDKIVILSRVNKITPLFKYKYKTFYIEVTNVIKDSVILTIIDKYNNKKKLTLYNFKNLFETDLKTTAEDYKIDYYSKIGLEYHIIDPLRFNTDEVYRAGVYRSNELDNRVLKDIACKLLENFKNITGVYPKTLFTAGSLARSYLLTLKDFNFNFKSIFFKDPLYNTLLDYSMRSYHGGKIESYILGYVPYAKTIDITSAYPYAMSILPKLTNKILYSKDITKLKNYYYAFINCTIKIDDIALIHPTVIPSPINYTNISPYGTFEAVITKIEYDYLLDNNASVIVKDYIAVEHINEYPYKNMIGTLFTNRINNITTNLALSGLFKTILNSLYGITYELTDLYNETDNTIIWRGYRAGDFFNPLIASYITAITRTSLSSVSNHIIKNGGKVFLNMTDSIIYNGNITLDIFSKNKILGKYGYPLDIKDIIILGAGRYEYYNDFSKEYIIKSRGFNVKIRNKSFYKDLDLSNPVHITNKTLVTFYRATTKKFNTKQLGHLIDDEYIINPFNLGGKRIINNLKVNLKKEYTTTRPIYL